MEDVLQVAVHQLAQKGLLGQVGFPQCTYPHLFCTRLPQVGKPPKDVGEFLMLQSTKQAFEASLVELPRFTSGRFCRFFLALVLPLPELLNDSLDELLLITTDRRLCLATDVLQGRQSDRAQDSSRLNSFSQYSLEAGLLAPRRMRPNSLQSSFELAATEMTEQSLGAVRGHVDAKRLPHCGDYFLRNHHSFGVLEDQPNRAQCRLFVFEAIILVPKLSEVRVMFDQEVLDLCNIGLAPQDRQ